MLKCCSRVSFQAHWLGYRSSPSTSPSVLVASNNLKRWRPRRSSGLRPGISLGEAGKVLQPSVPLEEHAVPVDPEHSLPRSFPSGTAAVIDAASVFRGLELAAGDEYGSGVNTAQELFGQGKGTVLQVFGHVHRRNIEIFGLVRNVGMYTRIKYWAKM